MFLLIHILDIGPHFALEKLGFVLNNLDLKRFLVVFVFDKVVGQPVKWNGITYNKDFQNLFYPNPILFSMSEQSQQQSTDATYNRKLIEKKWQEYWKKEKIYKFDFAKRRPYIIDNPPRYASGSLHLGHATHYTHIDFIARYKRLKGFNVMFPLCFDVNGMPIEVNVEKKYNIKMNEYDRQEFIKLCSEFANQNIGEMTRQFMILGESMDDSVYYQTDAEYYRKLTQISFIKLYKKGIAYKGEHPINYCPRCSTALAESEVEYQTRKTKLNYILFELENGEKIQIATTRPELLCTCQLIAINPNDERINLVGRKAKTPLFERWVSIVEDEKVDMHFGTGIVMICSIGDKDDLEWIYKYNLKIEKGIDENGKMTELAGKYKGMEIKIAREKIIEELKNADLLIKQEDLEQNIGECWRCHTPIEFLVKKQWFLRTIDFKDLVLKNAEKMKWYPEFMKKRLQDWVNSLSWDWVISRQRYFATPIPVWECDCGEILCADEEECYVQPTINLPKQQFHKIKFIDGKPICPKCKGILRGSEEVFDTWMDSSISPLYNAFWLRDKKLFAKLYPNGLRPQSHDIIRTWAFYTILRGVLLTKKIPFKEIFIDGFIMAEDGIPMHASLGNAVEPLDILEKYGADGFRYFATTCSLGIDNAFREKEVVHGVRLCTKFYNIEKFIGNVIKNINRIMKNGKIKFDKRKLKPIDRWILSKYSKLVKIAENYCNEFQFDKAMKEIEFFLWHEFADHYIEIVKYRKEQQQAIFTLYTIGLGIAKLLSPFLPHITEEVYQNNFKEIEKEKSIHLTKFPKPILIDEISEKNGEIAKGIIAQIRSWKNENKISLSAELNFVEIIVKEQWIDEIEGSKAKGQIHIGQKKMIDILKKFKDVIKNTIKAKELEIVEKEELEEKIIAIKPNYKILGPKFKEQAKEIINLLLKENAKEVAEKLKDGFELKLANGEVVKLTEEDVFVEKSLSAKGREVNVIKVGEVVVLVGK